MITRDVLVAVYSDFGSKLKHECWTFSSEHEEQIPKMARETAAQMSLGAGKLYVPQLFGESGSFDYLFDDGCPF